MKLINSSVVSLSSVSCMCVPRGRKRLCVCVCGVSLHAYLLNVVAATVEVCESVARPRVSVHACICAEISQCSLLRSIKRVLRLLIVSDRQVKGSEGERKGGSLG